MEFDYNKCVTRRGLSPEEYKIFISQFADMQVIINSKSLNFSLKVKEYFQDEAPRHRKRQPDPSRRIIQISARSGGVFQWVGRKLQLL